LVGSPPTDNNPPSKSSGAKLWERIMDENHFTRPGDLALLKQACIMTNRADALAEQIDADGGPVLYIHGVSRPHPALKAELDARAFVTRTLCRLGVVGEVKAKKPGPGRPPSGIGVTWEQMQGLRGQPDDY
jgi:hypothetical protein